MIQAGINIICMKVFVAAPEINLIFIQSMCPAICK